jgi:hypothetical protein
MAHPFGHDLQGCEGLLGYDAVAEHFELVGSTDSLDASDMAFIEAHHPFHE